MRQHQCFRVHSTQFLGLSLLLLAWSGVLISSFLPDWRRSIVEVSRRKYGKRIVRSYNETYKEYGLKIEKENYLQKDQKWRMVGFKGLWNECAYLPTSLLASISLVSSSKRQVYQDKNNNFENQTLSVKLPKLSSKVFTKISRKKQCTSITLEKSSCLLLGIRTMIFLSMICGTLSVFLAIVSVFSDSRIRSLSRYHPFIHRFRHRNAIAVLAGVTASLSGSLALTGCWWFTLNSSTHFFVTSYQHQHEESGAVFICGSSLMIAIGSGFTYVFGGILVGVHVQRVCFLSRFSVIFDRERGSSGFTNLGSKNVVHHTQC